MYRTPILSVAYGGKRYTIGDNTPGEMTRKLYEEFRSIQLGDKPDELGLLYIVDV